MLVILVDTRRNVLILTNIINYYFKHFGFPLNLIRNQQCHAHVSHWHDIGID